MPRASGKMPPMMPFPFRDASALAATLVLVAATVAATPVDAQTDPLPIAPPGADLPTKPKAPRAASAPEAAASAPAAESTSKSTTPIEPSPLWELGAFAFGTWQPAYPGSDTHLDRGGALPWAVYRGKILRLESGQIGLRAVRTPRYEWDVTGAFAFGGGANKVAARAGMPTIGTLAEAGPLLRINLGPLDQGLEAARRTRLELPVRAVFDLNDDFHQKGWTFEPTLGHTWWRTDFSTFNSSIGMLFGDRRMNDLFYGVAPEFAIPGVRPMYDARAGLIATRLHSGLNLRLSRSVHLYGGVGIESVKGAANEGSPLVKRQTDMSVGVGLTWSIWQSDQKAVE